LTEAASIRVPVVGNETHANQSETNGRLAMVTQQLGETLASIKGFLIDLDGTLYVGDQLIPGAKEFVHRLREAGTPHAFVTNITSRPRSQVLARIRRKGLEIDPEQVLTAPIATKQYLDREGIGHCFFLTRPSLIEDFVGHPQTEDEADAVVVGDMGSTITFQHLNTAFRLLLDGARFVTMSRSRYFREADGMTLDAGAFVALLEHASGREALVTGKPSAEFFQSGLELLGLAADEVAMIGDDLDSDVRGAQDCGLSGMLVLSGKTSAAPPADQPSPPDMVAGSVADLLEFI
jgi:HAD superfamily hydrolase (TIGR01458 family)